MVGGASAMTVGWSPLVVRSTRVWCQEWLPTSVTELSKSTAPRVCEELRERYEAFKRRDLYDLNLVALFLDATYLAVRPDGPKEGVLVAWASPSRASGCCWR
jgi:transposase-like protein